ncbi:hypothetical protein G7Z17_g12716 [Cylindrodendrum hubeiense]|uniref:Altered inheritance of mitochondria protein 6 n=1 Tax=Cylindrodendrum hubeiense TaxID=595255 RepID=A0A9P5GXT2_9HYPO|nr:hypothetical protein G7Z17_g12716 [Cylindrodendrum hubeiense]
MAGYFCGSTRKNSAEYEALPSISPVDSWEAESLLLEQKLRAFGICRALGRLWRTTVFVAALFVTTFLVLYAYQSSGLAFVDLFDGNGNSTESATKWVDELSTLVSPAMCHSHNDYLRPHPLFTALTAGCASVEADVWLSKDGKDLLVAHHWWSLSSSRTLRSLYIDPLVQILDSMNSPYSEIDPDSTRQAFGVFARSPETPLILYIDVKDDPATTWPVVLEQLKPLRDRRYLSRHEKMPSWTTNQSFWPGPITVVGTGNIGKRRDVNIGNDPERWHQHHDVFLDAPLDLLNKPGLCRKNDSSCMEIQENEFYTASVSLWSTLGSVFGGFSQSQLKIMRAQIQAAKDLNLLSRYWELPSWPVSYRNYVWRVITREGVDLLNADDVVSAARRYWVSDYMRDVALHGSHLARVLGLVLLYRTGETILGPFANVVEGGIAEDGQVDIQLLHEPRPDLHEKKRSGQTELIVCVRVSQESMQALMVASDVGAQEWLLLLFAIS